MIRWYSDIPHHVLSIWIISNYGKDFHLHSAFYLNTAFSQVCSFVSVYHLPFLNNILFFSYRKYFACPITLLWQKRRKRYKSPSKYISRNESRGVSRFIVPFSFVLHPPGGIPRGGNVVNKPVSPGSVTLRKTVLLKYLPLWSTPWSSYVPLSLLVRFFNVTETVPLILLQSIPSTRPLIDSSWSLGRVGVESWQ